jgi:gamma-glutamyltranspeptidase/glutathione hydrolase
MTLARGQWLRAGGPAAYHGIDTVLGNHREAHVPGTFTTRPQLAGTFGMVASTHWLASAAGMAVLEKGGNAFDAAVAAGLVLQVVEPHLNGPGGEVPVVGFATAADGVFVLNGQGTAPAAATLEAFGALGLDLVPGTGLLAACVPAAFGTWMLLLDRYGTLRLRDVMEYAIGYAANGYPMLDNASAAIGAVAETFREHWPSSADVYLPGGVAPEGGSRFANPDLARTYTRILEEAEAASDGRSAQIEAARAAFYEGFVAEAISGFLSRAEVMDVSGTRHRGLLTADDLAAWRAAVEAPVTLDWGGLTVCKTGPWGQGPVFLQQLALLDGFDLRSMGHGSADFVHTVTECAKLAFADREAWYGDPQATDVPLAELLSPSYAEQRRGLVGAQASASLIPGAPAGAEPRLPGFAAPWFGASGGADGGTVHRGHGAGEPLAASSGMSVPELGPGDTCHVDVADSFGNLVSATPSGGWLQSSPVIPGLGFCLGTRAQMFTLTPGLASTLAPRRRPRTTLSPSLALRDGEPYLAFGTPGGDQQDQWTLGVFLNHVLFGMNLQEAIDAPAFHTSHFPSSFYPRESVPRSLFVEDRFPAAVVDELRRRGHDVRVMPAWSLGRVSAVARDRGFLYAGANPRGMQGYAVGRLCGPRCAGLAALAGPGSPRRRSRRRGGGHTGRARPATATAATAAVAASTPAADPVPAGCAAAPAASTSSPSPAAISGACGRSTASRPRDSARWTANRYASRAAPSSPVCQGRERCRASSTSTATTMPSAHRHCRARSARDAATRWAGFRKPAPAGPGPSASLATLSTAQAIATARIAVARPPCRPGRADQATQAPASRPAAAPVRAVPAVPAASAIIGVSP